MSVYESCPKSWQARWPVSQPATQTDRQSRYPDDGRTACQGELPPGANESDSRRRSLASPPVTPPHFAYASFRSRALSVPNAVWDRPFPPTCGRPLTWLADSVPRCAWSLCCAGLPAGLLPSSQSLSALSVTRSLFRASYLCSPLFFALSLSLSRTQTKRLSRGRQNRFYCGLPLFRGRKRERSRWVDGPSPGLWGKTHITTQLQMPIAPAVLAKRDKQVGSASSSQSLGQVKYIVPLLYLTSALCERPYIVASGYSDAVRSRSRQRPAGEPACGCSRSSKRSTSPSHDARAQKGAPERASRSVGAFSLSISLSLHLRVCSSAHGSCGSGKQHSCSAAASQRRETSQIPWTKKASTASTDQSDTAPAEQTKGLYSLVYGHDVTTATTTAVTTTGIQKT